MSNELVLPDSRLASSVGSVMADFVAPDGTKHRLEMIPVFCANCGVPYGFVPKENTTWACWLCNPCFERWGVIAGTYAVPDAAYWKKVEEAMIEHFGRALNQFELQRLAEQGWGPLAKLVKESPIKVKG